MYKVEKDRLFLLVKSMDKGEKRNFKLFANRIKHVDKAKFVALFDVLGVMKKYDESIVLKKMKNVSKQQIPNIKRHLYKQILKSLRLIHQSKDIEIQIREQLDYAEILYGKGLYLDSLRILDRVRKLAVAHHEQLLLLEVLEFQKRIEGRHITRSRSVKQRMEHLIEDAQRMTELTKRMGTLSNLALSIHGYFIKNGHVRNEQQKNEIMAFFVPKIQAYTEDDLIPPEKISLEQSQVWLNYIVQDYQQCLQHADTWVKVFDQYPKMILSDVSLYLRGLHYAMNMCYYLGKYEMYCRYFDKMLDFKSNYSANLNNTDRMMYFVYHSNAILNKYMLCGDFEGGLQNKSKILHEIGEYMVFLDKHRILILYYKLSWMHFVQGELDDAMELLNEIINTEGTHLREDVLYYSKLMHLMIHLEWGHTYLLDSLFASLKRFTQKFTNKSVFHTRLIEYLIARKEATSKDEKRIFAVNFKSWMDTWFKDLHEKRVLTYFDFYSWILSHLNGTSMTHEIQKRYQQQKGIMSI